MHDTSAATKGDLSELKKLFKDDLKRLERIIMNGFKGVSERFDGIDEKFEQERGYMDAALNILGNTDIKVKDHERRIINVEKVVAA